MNIIVLVSCIIFFRILLCYLAKKYRIASIKKRMQWPSVDLIPIIMRTEGTGHEVMLLRRICETCLTTVDHGEYYCNKCGKSTTPARPFLTCHICLTEQSTYNDFCEKCGEKLEKVQYLHEWDREKFSFHSSLKLNPAYRGEIVRSE